LEYKIDKETAELEFTCICEMWEIDCEIDDMDEEDRKSFEEQKRKIIYAIRRGRLTVDDEIVYTLAYPEANCTTVTIKRPKGQALMSTDRCKDKENFKRTYSILASMTGREVSFFSRLDGIDLKVLMAFFALFFGS
jgi:hypothetical protein